MSYLDTLKSFKRQEGVPTKPTEPSFDGFVGMPPSHFQENGPSGFPSRQWGVCFADRDELLVLYVSGASFDRVAIDYPKAGAAQPVTPDQCCLACIHYARPGMSEGYCGGRGDVPLAYGEGHPLRKLPEDNGANCEKWAPVWQGEKQRNITNENDTQRKE